MVINSLGEFDVSPIVVPVLMLIELAEIGKVATEKGIELPKPLVK